MINKVTLWFKGKWKRYNHLEEGWSRKGEPISNCEFQKRQWKSNMWHKRWAFIEWYDEDIPKVVPDYRSE